MTRTKKATWAIRIAVALIVLFALAQVVRPERSNPPVDPAKTLQATTPVPPQVSAVFARSCQNCHSSLTEWPWYSQIAPVSWLIADDVNDGRRELSLSAWGEYNDRRKARKLQEICEQVEQHKMPIAGYVFMHPQARLNDADRRAICDWTAARRATLPPVTSAAR